MSVYRLKVILVIWPRKLVKTQMAVIYALVLKGTENWTTLVMVRVL